MNDTRQYIRSMKVDKPPFSLPSMEDICSIPWNGYNVVSTFSGCGGSCLGYRMAGFKVLWASEFIPEAASVYRANHPDSILCTKDIRQTSAEEILSAIHLKEGELDLLDGSPPCVSFSQIGKSKHTSWETERAYSGTKQRTDDLFFEYVRILRGLMPKVFVAENVGGLTRGPAKGVFKEILAELKQSGYRVQARILDAQWLGIPQERHRTIFVGVRSDLNLDPVHPDPLPYRYFVNEIFPYITQIKFTTSYENWLPANRPTGAITQSDGKRKSDSAYLSVFMVNTDKGKRKYTIDELKTLSTFPADFSLSGDFEEQWERIGRAVPPRMMMYIALTIREKILDVLKSR